MKKTVMMILVMMACMAASAFAVPTIELVNTTGSWQINQPVDPGDTFIFTQDIVVNKALAGITDPLVGAYIHLPDMVVGGIGGGAYTLSGGNIRITDSSTPGSETVVYFDGTIGSGDLVPIGTLALGYTVFQADITNVTINNTINSLALTALLYCSPDFQISFTGANAGFANMLENGLPGADSFSAAITIPEPATIVLLCLGGLGLLRRRGKRQR